MDFKKIYESSTPNESILDICERLNIKCTTSNGYREIVLKNYNLEPDADENILCDKLYIRKGHPFMTFISVTKDKKIKYSYHCNLAEAAVLINIPKDDLQKIINFQYGQ